MSRAFTRSTAKYITDTVQRNEKKRLKVKWIATPKNLQKGRRQFMQLELSPSSSYKILSR